MHAIFVYMATLVLVFYFYENFSWPIYIYASNAMFKMHKMWMNTNCFASFVSLYQPHDFNTELKNQASKTQIIVINNNKQLLIYIYTTIIKYWIENKKKICNKWWYWPNLAFISIFSVEALRPGLRPRFPLSLRSCNDKINVNTSCNSLFLC